MIFSAGIWNRRLKISINYFILVTWPISKILPNTKLFRLIQNLDAQWISQRRKYLYLCLHSKFASTLPFTWTNIFLWLSYKTASFRDDAWYDILKTFKYTLSKFLAFCPHWTYFKISYGWDIIYKILTRYKNLSNLNKTFHRKYSIFIP